MTEMNFKSNTGHRQEIWNTDFTIISFNVKFIRIKGLW